MLVGTKFLIIKRGIRILPTSCTSLGVPNHVAFFMNLATQSTTVGGTVYIDHNMKGTPGVVHGWQPWKCKACMKELPISFMPSSLSDKVNCLNPH